MRNLMSTISPLRLFSLLFATLFPLIASVASRAEPSPLYGFGGLDLGVGRAGARVSPERPVSGLQFDLKGQGSYYSRRSPWVYDLGLGWQWGRREGNFTDRSHFKSITRGFFLEAQARWIFYPTRSERYLPSFSVGPLLLASFTADAALDERSPVYFGAQAMMDSPMNGTEWLQRFGVKIAFDLNVPNRSAFLGQFTYQIGLPILGYLFHEPRVRPTGIIHHHRPLKRFRLVLDGRKIEFDTAKSSLRPDSRARIEAAGRFLRENLERWQKLVVTGHTDERGSYAYNQKLSESRARQVKEALIAGGIPAARILTRGKSESEPVDPGHDESAWQKNRRVEFDFGGVSEIEAISRGLFETTTVEGREVPNDGT